MKKNLEEFYENIKILVSLISFTCNGLPVNGMIRSTCNGLTLIHNDWLNEYPGNGNNPLTHIVLGDLMTEYCCEAIYTRLQKKVYTLRFVEYSEGSRPDMNLGGVQFSL